MAEVEELRSVLSEIEISDNALQLVHPDVLPRMKYGFFPGGNGLYRGIDATAFPVNGVLVLGNNFGSQCDFVEPIGEKNDNELWTTDERGNATWRGLRRLLRRAKIDLDVCFFTNAWPFFLDGRCNLDGRVERWLRNKKLMDDCLCFFRSTLDKMKPRLVVALGTAPAAFLGYGWENISTWKKYSWQAVDKGEGASPLTTIKHSEQQITCAVIAHPSMKNRKSRGSPYNTEEGEIDLLKEAVKRAKL